MMCALSNHMDKTISESTNPIPISLLTLQAEEWMLLGERDKAEAIYLQVKTIYSST